MPNAVGPLHARCQPLHYCAQPPRKGQAPTCSVGYRNSAGRHSQGNGQRQSRVMGMPPPYSYSADRVWRIWLPANTRVRHPGWIYVSPCESVLLLLCIRVKSVEHILVKFGGHCPAERALRLFCRDNAIVGYLPDSSCVLHESCLARAWALVKIHFATAFFTVAGRAWRSPPGIDNAVQPQRKSLCQHLLLVGQPASKLRASSRKYPENILQLCFSMALKRLRQETCVGEPKLRAQRSEVVPHRGDRWYCHSGSQKSIMQISMPPISFAYA